MKIFKEKAEFYKFLSLSELSEEFISKRKYFFSIQSKKMRVFRFLTLLLFYIFLRLLVFPIEAFLITESSFEHQLYPSIDVIIIQVLAIIGIGLTILSAIYYVVSKQYYEDFNLIDSMRSCLHKEKEQDNIFLEFETCTKCKRVFFDSNDDSKLFNKEKSPLVIFIYLIAFSIGFFILDVAIQDIFIPPTMLFLLFDLFAIPAIFLSLYFVGRQLPVETQEQVTEIIVFLMLMALLLIILFPIGLMVSEISYTL